MVSITREDIKKRPHLHPPWASIGLSNQEAFLMSPATYNQYPTIRDGKSQGESLSLPPGILPSLQRNLGNARLPLSYVQPSPSEGGPP